MFQSTNQPWISCDFSIPKFGFMINTLSKVRMDITQTCIEPTFFVAFWPWIFCPQKCPMQARNMTFYISFLAEIIIKLLIEGPKRWHRHISNYWQRKKNTHMCVEMIISNLYWCLICVHILYVYIIYTSNSIWVNWNSSLYNLNSGHLGMIPLTNHRLGWGRHEVVMIYPDSIK